MRSLHQNIQILVQLLENREVVLKFMIDNKKVFMNQSESSLPILLESLRRRFSLYEIQFQHYYIKRINKNLEISLDSFMKDPSFHQYDPSQILIALNQTPQFYVGNEKVKILYPRSERTVLITGIILSYVKKIVSRYNQKVTHPNYYKNYKIQEEEYNDNWARIVLNSNEAAENFQKHFRNEKRKLENDKSNHFRYSDNRRIRIFILEDDFYTFLIDIMGEEQKKAFEESFGKKTFKGLLYRPVCYDFEGYFTSSTQEFIEEQVSQSFSSVDNLSLTQTQNSINQMNEQTTNFIYSDGDVQQLNEQRPRRESNKRDAIIQDFFSSETDTNIGEKNNILYERRFTYDHNRTQTEFFQRHQPTQEKIQKGIKRKPFILREQENMINANTF